MFSHLNLLPYVLATTGTRQTDRYNVHKVMTRLELAVVGTTQVCTNLAYNKGVTTHVKRKPCWLSIYGINSFHIEKLSLLKWNEFKELRKAGYLIPDCQG